MSDKDINIHVRARDTEQTKKQIGDVAGAAEQLGKKTSEGQRVAAESTVQATEKMSIFGSMLNKAANYVLALYGGVKAINAVTAAIKLQSDAIKEHADIALEQQNKLLRLQFLGDYYKEKPELRKQVMAASEAARRPFEDVANAMYDLHNLGTGLTDKQQQDILDKSIELGRTMPETPLNKIVQSMVFFAKQTKEKDVGKIQNIIKQTLTEAGGEPGEAAADLSKFLPLGLSAGMTAPEAAGTWAYITSQFPEAGRATTALSGIMMALQGKGTDDSKRLLRRLGISPGTPFLQQIQQLSQQQAAGKLHLKDIEELASTKEAPVLAALLQDPEAMMKTIESINTAGQSQENLTQKSIEGLYGQDEMARLEDMSRFLDISVTNLKAMDTKAVRLEVGKKLHETLLRKAGVPELAIGIEKVMDWFFSGALGKTMGRWEDYSKEDILTALKEEVVVGPGEIPIAPPENLQQTKLPLDPNLPEPNEIPANLNSKTSFGDKKRPIVINNNQNYDSSINYYPTVGEFESRRFDPNE